MFKTPDLTEDYHVHSTYSGGVDTLEANVAWAESIGVTRLVAVEHVSRESQHISDLADAVRLIRQRTTLPRLGVGVEAQLLDADGFLDVPQLPSGIDAIYIAAHQYPSSDGPLPPDFVRHEIVSGNLSPERAVQTLLAAMRRAMLRYAGRRRLVLAHAFSVLPRIGLCESMLANYDILRFARVAARTNTIVEVSERWRCPSERVVRALLARGVSLVASTDAHSASDIARYDFVAGMAQSLREGLVL